MMAVLATLAITNARAQDLYRELPHVQQPAPAPVRHYIDSTQATGTIIKKQIRWESKIPLDKTYDQLSAEEKAELFSQYEKLEPGDEPPFPAQGIKPIFNAIKKAQRLRQARGDLDLSVTVGPDGNAVKVEDYSEVMDGDITEMAQQVLLLTKYKPAICKGQPCTMQFRFRQSLKAG